MQPELSQEDRKKMQSSIDLRKTSNEVEKMVSSTLQNVKQKENGIAGCDSISKSMEKIMLNLGVKTNKIEFIYPTEPDETGRYFDEQGRGCFDPEIFQNYIAINGWNGEEGHGNDPYKRFDICGFPENKRDRDFILSHDFENLESIVLSFRTNNLFLWGGVGLGKTSLATRVAWESIKNHPSERVDFISVGPWLKAQMPEKEKPSPEEISVREKYKKISGENAEKIIILDEVDKWPIHSEYICNIFFHFIDELTKRDCRIIFTSNTSPEEIKEKGHRNILPAFDRVKQNTIFLDEFKGESLR